jgi:hypothetical protein
MLNLTTIAAAVLLLLTIAAGSQAVGQYTPFGGGKSRWHDGFERFDYVMDEQTLAITPFRLRKVRSLPFATRPRGSGAAWWSRPQSRRRATHGPGRATGARWGAPKMPAKLPGAIEMQMSSSSFRPPRSTSILDSSICIPPTPSWVLSESPANRYVGPDPKRTTSPCRTRALRIGASFTCVPCVVSKSSNQV